MSCPPQPETWDCIRDVNPSILESLKRRRNSLAARICAEKFLAP